MYLTLCEVPSGMTVTRTDLVNKPHARVIRQIPDRHLTRVMLLDRGFGTEIVNVPEGLIVEVVPT